jgi:hypothetical protein
MNDTLIIIKYIATWAWFILSMMFLNISIIGIMLHNYQVTIGMIIPFIVCLVMALRRKTEVYNEN